MTEQELQKLAERLLEALLHIEGCLKCNEDDWDNCTDGGREAKRTMKEAREKFHM